MEVIDWCRRWLKAALSLQSSPCQRRRPHSHSYLDSLQPLSTCFTFLAQSPPSSPPPPRINRNIWTNNEDTHTHRDTRGWSRHIIITVIRPSVNKRETPAECEAETEWHCYRMMMNVFWQISRARYLTDKVSEAEVLYGESLIDPLLNVRSRVRPNTPRHVDGSKCGRMKRRRSLTLPSWNWVKKCFIWVLHELTRQFIFSRFSIKQERGAWLCFLLFSE